MRNYAVTPSQMKFLENASLNGGISFYNLMEFAGEKLAEYIKTFDKKIVTFICGKGNNGGDGFVSARILAELDYEIYLVLPLGEPLTDISKTAFSKLNSKVIIVEKIPIESEIIVDCLFGTGFKGEILQENLVNILEISNNSSAIKIACDIPSGGNALSGSCSKSTFNADYTVTFGYKKVGQLFQPLKSFCGEISVVDINLDKSKIFEIDEKIVELTNDFVYSMLPERDEYSNKGDFGTLLNISGCEKYIGAAGLSTISALRCGVGIATLATTKNVISSLSSAIFEATFLELTENFDENIVTLRENLQRKTAILFGCGRGNSEITKKLLQWIIKNVEVPIIIDADGINVLTSCIDCLREAKNEVILTPHLGEFSRLTGFSVKEIEENRLAISREFCKKYKVNLVLKSAGTLITTSSLEQFVSSRGDCGLAKGGSGDILAGMISSFIAQKIEVSNGMILGTYFHSLAGELASEKFSKRAMLPSDLIDFLPSLFKN